MADITKCKGTNCPRQSECYRFIAPTSEYRQSYFIVVPLKEDKSCDEFWESYYSYCKRNNK
jgi:hypothetical protein